MVAESTEESGDPEMDKTVYCLCGTTYDPNIFMIQCDICKDWYHGSCCNFKEYTAIELERFHCPRCVDSCGPSVYKPYLNGHRHDYWDDNASLKPVQTGTPVFVRELCARHFNNDTEIVVRMSANQLTDALLLQQGFSNPIVVENPEGLEMIVPPSNFSLYDVEAFIGGHTEIEVIDVTRQADLKMKLRDYVGYYNTLNRHRIFNVVSLEFSNTALGRLVEAPLIARKLDWANTMWPKDYYMAPPQVQKYCLMSVKDSFTDFHVDFGGTSVWYHVLRGEKIFYFIKPNNANLTLYQQWMTSTNQSEMFFGDQADCCYKSVLRQGQTMLIPTGWIHAVYTPTDSLVFGGNFLHSLDVSTQLQIYDIEKKIKTIEKFRFPNFECMNWFAAQNMHSTLKELNSEETRCPDTLLNSLKTLTTYLKRWLNNKYHCYFGKAQVPEGLNHTKLLKDIGKEVRHAEKYIHSIEPPKPERESKRTRRRPLNKDFVDYSLSSKSSQDWYISQVKPRQPQRIPPLKLTLPKPATYPYKSSPAKKNLAEIIPETHCQRPEETTAIHRGGAVLQFRLGTKDYFSRTQSNEVSSTSTKSVYDFHDDSEHEDEAVITTTKKARKLSKKTQSSKPQPIIDTTWVVKSTVKEELETDFDFDFNYLEDSDVIIKNEFMDSEVEEEKPFHNADSTVTLSLLVSDATLSSSNPVDDKPCLEEENISKVHQDDDYIYPSLDNSDDEEVSIFKPRGRSRIDEPWSPKAKVGPLLPKMNRPTREGTRKQAVEKVLEAAAAKRAFETVEKSPKRQYRKRKPKPKIEKKKISQPSTSTAAPTTSTAVTVHKQRKGMKTVKQRLGKILKIHKMMH